MTGTTRKIPDSVRAERLKPEYTEIGFPKTEFLRKSAYYVDAMENQFGDKKKATEGIGPDARNVGEVNSDVSTWTWYDTRSSWLD